MRRAVLLVVTLLAFAPASAQSRKTLDVFFVDVEGGQATLIVSPSGESMLVDAGWSGVGGRDADRIAAVAKQAGVSRIDYMLVTHYHRDHVGGVPEIVAKLPIGTFIDYGQNLEPGNAAEMFAAYEPVRAKGRHLVPKPGDKLPIKGIEMVVASAGGEVATSAIGGSAAPNPLCRDFKPADPDPTENARSLGTVITFGSFRMLDLGDLTWNKEYGLACPANLLGTFDVYLTTHHGTASSGPPALVHAIRPRVVVMNNGATKGGSSQALQVIRAAPGLEDVWQLHYAMKAAAAENTAEPFIANMEESTSHGIRLTVSSDGSFVVTNGRNGHSKTYRPR